jgi:hypothetical protein
MFRLAILTTIGLYALSLLLPAVTCAGGGDVPGWGILLMGWLGLLALDPRWFANLLFVLMAAHSLVGTPERRSRAGAVMLTVWPVAAATLAIASLTLDVYACGDGAGSVSKVRAMAVGAYFWATAILAMSVFYLGRFLVFPPPGRRGERH